jgi:prepilin-type N-terminal cleavage/methylation domain-containing protein
MRVMRKSVSGFSIIEMLVVLGVIGILAAIAIPMFLNAQNRGKQAQTVANMRAIATAIELRAADLKSYSSAGADFPIPRISVSFEEMTAMLTPKYIQVLPRVDGWGFPLTFHLDQPIGNTEGARTYAIRSPGRDGIMTPTGADGSSYKEGKFDCFDCDIVFSNGSFVAWPEGAQK